MASNVSGRSQGRDRRRDSGYRSPSESSYDSRTEYSYYDDDHSSQRTAQTAEEPKSKTETLTKFAVGAAIVYGILKIWNGEKNAEKDRRRRKERKRDFERRKAARRREDDRREREREMEEESEYEESEVTEVKRIGYAPSRSRSRRARSRATSRATDERDDPRLERSRSRGPPKIAGPPPPSPPPTTRASNVEGHGYEEYRSKSRLR